MGRREPINSLDYLPWVVTLEMLEHVGVIVVQNFNLLFFWLYGFTLTTNKLLKLNQMRNIPWHHAHHLPSLGAWCNSQLFAGLVGWLHLHWKRYPGSTVDCVVDQLQKLLWEPKDCRKGTTSPLYQLLLETRQWEICRCVPENPECYVLPVYVDLGQQYGPQICWNIWDRPWYVP